MDVYKKEDWTVPRTGVVCLIVSYIVYVYKHLYPDQITAMLRKVTGLKSDEGKSSHQPLPLGPHDSYRTLALSVLSCAVTLVIIWSIQFIPFQKLYKCSPLYKLVKILFNSPDLDSEENSTIPRENSEQTARHEQILNTCMELERRMCQLEHCLAPLARSLQNLSDVIETRNEPPSRDHPEDRVTDELDITFTGFDDFALERNSQVADRQNSNVENRLNSIDLQSANKVDSPDANATESVEISQSMN